MNNEDRVDQFEVEVARLRLKTNLRSFEKTASKLSVVLMIIAVVIGFASYVQSTNADNSLDQNELVILALACITLSIVGGVLFAANARAGAPPPDLNKPQFFLFWLLGLVTSSTIGGFIHILLVIAVIMILVNFISGRRRG